ncbi:NERD domain-containing protein [Streptomyces sp. NPDC008150]|uniref:nuclease-related domain-containing protein n=1 Tax=Streptomyces sp. NPDC008150 TaxID=3364816 RepID=UPI0036E07A92
MSDLSVNVWNESGKHRVYVNLPDRTVVAWADLLTGTVEVRIARYRSEALRLLVPHLRPPAPPEPPAPSARTAPAAPSAPPGQPAPPARPAPPGPSGAPGPSAPADPPTASAPSVPAAPPAPPAPTAPPPPAARPPLPPRAAGLPPLTPETDLARNGPGATLVERLARAGHRPTPGFLARLREQHDEWAAWQSAVIGERKVGRELERLGRHGWKVLHSLPDGRGGDIDHLLVGPGGVLTFTTERHPGAVVQVGDKTVRINHGEPRPYAAPAHSEARRVRAVLELHAGFEVPVEPVLVFVDAAEIQRAPTQYTVRVYDPAATASLAPLTGRLTPARITTLYDIARRRGVWTEDG